MNFFLHSYKLMPFDNDRVISIRSARSYTSYNTYTLNGTLLCHMPNSLPTSLSSRYQGTRCLGSFLTNHSFSRRALRKIQSSMQRSCHRSQFASESKEQGKHSMRMMRNTEQQIFLPEKFPTIRFVVSCIKPTEAFLLACLDLETAQMPQDVPRIEKLYARAIESLGATSPSTPKLQNL